MDQYEAGIVELDQSDKVTINRFRSLKRRLRLRDTGLDVPTAKNYYARHGYGNLASNLIEHNETKGTMKSFRIKKYTFANWTWKGNINDILR